ncbi:MAG TPA: DNA translocase FtsK 4TM domain-containing protein [Bacillota bacterium]|nr:DNA translocase FtsK 4TM domain-containing protein [Bacillota bacterium]
MPRTRRRPDNDFVRELMGIALAVGGAVGVFALLFPGAGWVGRALAQALIRLAGQGAVLLPLGLTAAGVTLIAVPGRPLPARQAWGTGLLMAAVLGLLHLRYPPAEFFARAAEGGGGGLIGAGLAWLLTEGFGAVGGWLVLAGLFLAGLVLVSSVPLTRLGTGAMRLTRKCGGRLLRATRDFFVVEVEDEQRPSRGGARELPMLNVEPAGPPRGPCPEPIAAERPAEPPAYQLPPLSLLSRGSVGATSRQRPDSDERRRLIEETMASFGVRARVVEVQQGPMITRFEVQPAAGVKVARVVALADDLALALAAQDVRIAPIPGKGVIGVEVPNTEVAAVHLRDVLESQEFQEAPPGVTIALGKDIAGRPLVANLERLLHLLVAGTTGSGKSVCLNAIIAGILLSYPPDRVKLLMIDPKVVELKVYDGIPHLIAPVITDPRLAAGALRWVVREMENRYESFAAAGVRDISRYNAASPPAALPVIVVVIDELADLMKVAPAEVEDAIWRLAQMARAAGIHLVVATQRPSVDVVTGVIKANIPSRIAFAMSSQVDSRTILDAPGAERLLGQGDLLYLPVSATRAIRGQGAYIADGEVEEIVAFVKTQSSPEYREAVLAEGAPAESKEPEPEDDALFGDAVRVVMDTRQASISMVQRKLRVGYTRAARLIDAMEEKGIVSGPDGARPREILMSWEQFRRDFLDRKPRE